jgi:hypothetical protein
MNQFLFSDTVDLENTAVAIDEIEGPNFANQVMIWPKNCIMPTSTMFPCSVCVSLELTNDPSPFYDKADATWRVPHNARLSTQLCVEPSHIILF